MTDKPYVEPLGGSYVIDPKTGVGKRVAGTEEPKGAIQRPKPAPAATEPVSPDTEAKKGK